MGDESVESKDTQASTAQSCCLKMMKLLYSSLKVYLNNKTNVPILTMKVTKNNILKLLRNDM